MASENLNIIWNTSFYKWKTSSEKETTAEFRSRPSPQIMSTTWYLRYLSACQGTTGDPSLAKSKITIQLIRENSGKRLQIKGILFITSDPLFMYSFKFIMDNDTKHGNVFEVDGNSLSDEYVNLICTAWITELREREEKSVQTLSTSSKLLRDIHAMYGKQDHSDLIVIYKDVKICVHKFILSARSPVFAEMFQHATTESNNIPILITDIDPDIFEELLKFLYCGKISPSIYSKAHDLYYAAEKYMVSDLKDACRDVITSSLSVATAVKTLILADRYKDEEMRQKVVTFIASSFHKVTLTEPWIILLKENYLLAAQVLSLVGSKISCRNQ